MKVLFVARTGLDFDFFYDKLENNLAEVTRVQRPEIKWVAESGRTARAQKLARLFRHKGPLGWVATALDIACLQIYHICMTSLMAQKMRIKKTQPSRIAAEIDDVNEPRLIEIIREEKPDLILNYGTALYKAETLRLVGQPIVNIHSGKLPRYRNVHTDFWAYSSNDFNSIGVTFFEVSDAIDAGKILSWNPAKTSGDNPTLLDFKIGNLHSALESINSMIHTSSISVDEGMPSQTFETPKLWPTPTASDLCRYAYKEFRHAIARK